MGRKFLRFFHVLAENDPGLHLSYCKSWIYSTYAKKNMSCQPGFPIQKEAGEVPPTTSPIPADSTKLIYQMAN